MSIGLEGFSYTLTLGRKRVVVSNNVEASPQVTNPLKRMCSSDRISLNSEASPLEALPQDILVQVLSGVDHEDLRQLFHVSKTIREASLIAKELHFEYRTPKKKTFYFLTPLDLEDANGFQEKEAPNAPLIKKPKSRFNRKKLEDIAVTLFPFMDEEQ
ncbi:F-box protein At1g61340 [Cajanus cajan]|uniref:F-box protein SKIP27 n=1 Tax=Cajanus cajan TaxID=3821 RepID=A0A151T7G9_CAJCA|nr:F-box protein At1g61340 [Cajanus cajan]KYP62999.1 F-box protein SKIP27 [Cajanus cajan]